MISVLSGPGYVIKYVSLILKFGITYFAVLLPIFIYFYLKRNPITIHCSGCMEDGLTYKCKKGTGKHSAACKTYQTTMKGIIGTFNAIGSMVRVIISIPKAIMDIVMKVKGGIEDLAKLIMKLNPFTQLKNLLNVKVNMGGCKICTRDIASVLPQACVDPCAGLSVAINDGFLGPINSALESVSDVLEGLVGTLVDLVKDLVVVPIASVVKALIVELTKPIVALKNEVLGVLREVAGFVKLIIKTGLEIFFAFFTMWNHAVMNKVIRSLGFPKMFEVSPLTAFVITCIFLSLPIIGGWIGILGMVTKYSTKLLTVPFSLFEFMK